VEAVINFLRSAKCVQNVGCSRCAMVWANDLKIGGTCQAISTSVCDEVFISKSFFYFGGPFCEVGYRYHPTLIKYGYSYSEKAWQ